MVWFYHESITFHFNDSFHYCCDDFFQLVFSELHISYARLCMVLAAWNLFSEIKVTRMEG